MFKLADFTQAKRTTRQVTLPNVIMSCPLPPSIHYRNSQVFCDSHQETGSVHIFPHIFYAPTPKNTSLIKKKKKSMSI